MKQFLSVVLDHLIITTVLTVLLWLIGAVATGAINFFQWGVDARIFVLVVTNISAAIIQAGLKHNEYDY